MKYAKPTIMFIDAAKSLIQGVPKSVWPIEGPPQNAISVNAYEADESSVSGSLAAASAPVIFLSKGIDGEDPKIVLVAAAIRQSDPLGRVGRLGNRKLSQFHSGD